LSRFLRILSGFSPHQKFWGPPVPPAPPPLTPLPRNNVGQDAYVSPTPRVTSQKLTSRAARPTPADNLPILASIQPVELRRKAATLSPARRAMEPGHLLHSALTRPSSAVVRRLKSRHPFVPRRTTSHQFI